jgi:hypothetical protein
VLKLRVAGGRVAGHRGHRGRIFGVGHRGQGRWDRVLPREVDGYRVHLLNLARLWCGARFVTSVVRACTGVCKNIKEDQRVCYMMSFKCPLPSCDRATIMWRAMLALGMPRCRRHCGRHVARGGGWAGAHGHPWNSMHPQ